MCPMCVGSAVAYFVGGTSASGVALWAVRVFKRKRDKPL